MATTTDDGNTPDEPDKKKSSSDFLSAAAYRARVYGEKVLVPPNMDPTYEALKKIIKDQLEATSQQNVVQSAGEVNNIFVGGYNRADPGSALDKPSLAEQRQKFHFEFLNHSLKQAEWTFRLSVWFMTGGAAVILVGAVLALLRAGSPSHGYVPLVTSLTGALITVGGGALAVHARRARAHVTEQAQRIEDKIDADHQLETATTFINRVSDPDAKDRLNAAAAMKALNMQANQTMVNRLLPSDPPKEIEPGDTAE